MPVWDFLFSYCWLLFTNLYVKSTFLVYKPLPPVGRLFRKVWHKPWESAFFWWVLRETPECSQYECLPFVSKSFMKMTISSPSDIYE